MSKFKESSIPLFFIGHRGKDKFFKVWIFYGKMFADAEIYSEEQFKAFIFVSNSFFIWV